MRSARAYELQPLSFFLDNFGVDLSALDLNENHFLLEDVGHFPMLEAPDRFNAVLAEALGSCDS